MRGNRIKTERETGAGSSVYRKIKEWLYNLQVKLHQALTKNRKPRKNSSLRGKRRSDLIFFCVMLIFPVAQFCIMWIGVNINSILLSFKEYDLETGNYIWIGFQNFVQVIKDFGANRLVKYALKNSVIVYVVSNGATIPISLFFSFYIYKKYPGAGIFKVILFLPTIISGVVTSVTFTYLAERAYPELVEILFGKEVQGLLANKSTTFGALLFSNVFFGLGSQILLYSGAMGNVPDAVIEAAHLDGAGTLREFWHIILPYIFPTLSVFVTIGVAGILTADLALFTYFDVYADPNLYTFGYYMFRGIKTATIVEYPYYAAFGLVLTAVALPCTLIARKLLSKYGPSVD